MPKNRDTIFLVFRKHLDTAMETPIATFTTLERAEEYSGECLQQFLDKHITGFVFGVAALIHYDE